MAGACTQTQERQNSPEPHNRNSETTWPVPHMAAVLSRLPGSTLKSKGWQALTEGQRAHPEERVPTHTFHVKHSTAHTPHHSTKERPQQTNSITLHSCPAVAQPAPIALPGAAAAAI